MWSEAEVIMVFTCMQVITMQVSAGGIRPSFEDAYEGAEGALINIQ